MKRRSRAVQREAKPSDLRFWRRRLDALGEVAGGDISRDRSHLLQGTQTDADDEQREDSGRRHHAEADQRFLHEQLAERGSHIVDRNGKNDEVPGKRVLRPVDHPEGGHASGTGHVIRRACLVHSRIGQRPG